MPWEVVSSLILSIPRETWKTTFRDNKVLSAQFIHVEVGWGLGFLTPISIASPGSHLRFWLTSYSLEFPTIPFLGSFNLLEHLTEIIKTFYILYHQFILKEYKSQVLDMHGAKYMERCTKLPWSLRVPFSLAPMCSSHENPPKSCLWILTEVALDRYNGLICWLWW